MGLTTSLRDTAGVVGNEAGSGPVADTRTRFRSDTGSGALRSQFLEGSIRHRRLSPIEHSFTYPIGLYSVDLSEWGRLDRLATGFSSKGFNWVWLRRKDFFMPGLGPLDPAIRRHVKRATGWHPDGKIELITHPRYLGFSFNPVSFYCCYAQANQAEDNPIPRVILAQITNTPWNERHTYCLEAGPVHKGKEGWQTLRFRFGKAFHVSPFNPMAQDYDWLFSFRPGNLRVHMNVHQGGSKQFDATLVVRRRALDRTTLGESIRRYPFETLKSVLGIYWNALRLKLKGAVFHSHTGTHPEQSQVQDVPAIDSGKVTSWKI